MTHHVVYAKVVQLNVAFVCMFTGVCVSTCLLCMC